MINRKAKGTKGERDLIKALHDAGWSAIRSAGSGSSRYASPDILAGNAVRRIAIECKMTKESRKYFTLEDVDQLRTFSQRFGAESWVGVKFPDEPWYFLMLDDLIASGKCFVVSKESARLRGLQLSELVHTSSIDLNYKGNLEENHEIN